MNLVQSLKIVIVVITIVTSFNLVTYKAAEYNSSITGVITLNADEVIDSEAEAQNPEYSVILIASFTTIGLFLIAIKHKIRFQ